MNSESNQSPIEDTFDSPYERMIDYAVVDANDRKIGHVHHVYVEEDGQPLFIGIKTGWLFGHHYIVPAYDAHINDGTETVRIPYTEEQIKSAPNFEEGVTLLPADHDRIFSHYGVSGRGYQASAKTASATNPASTTDTTIPASEDVAESRTIKLKEEELKVGKRQVEAGGIRLRKIVRTETVNQPVELQREEIVIERVEGNTAAAADDTFQEEDVYIPLRREEPVVEKTARVREEVRVGKKTATEHQDVQGQVRKEDLQVDQNPTRRTQP